MSRYPPHHTEPGKDSIPYYCNYLADQEKKWFTPSVTKNTQAFAIIPFPIPHELHGWHPLMESHTAVGNHLPRRANQPKIHHSENRKKRNWREQRTGEKKERRWTVFSEMNFQTEMDQLSLSLTPYYTYIHLEMFLVTKTQQSLLNNRTLLQTMGLLDSLIVKSVTTVS